MGTVAWNPRNVSLPEPQLPPPEPDIQTTSTHSLPPQAPTTNTAPTAAAPEPKLVQFTPTYSPGNEGERPSLIPRSFTDGSQQKRHSTAGLEADDPRRTLIDQGYQVQDIDREANALADQVIDVEGARTKVQSAAGNEEQFWKGVYSRLTPEQNKELKSLAEAIETSPDKAAAQAKFDGTITPMLSTEQRGQLQTLQRQTQDAQIELNGQIVGKRLRDAQLSGNAEQLSLASADARVHVSDKHQLAANRKVEDAYALVMTPENQKTLAAPQKAVVDAVQQLSLDPGDKTAQQRVTDAKETLDDAQAQALSAEDKKSIDTLEAASERERDLGSLLVQEAQAGRRYVELSSVEKQRPLNETEKRILDLAKLDFGVVEKNRGMRDVAVQAANAEEGDREEILKDLDTKLTEFMRAKSDADIKRAEFTRDVAQSGSVPPGTTQDTSAGKIHTVALTETTSTGAKQSLTVGKEFAAEMPSTELTVDQASKNLDAVKGQRDELEEMLKPPPQPEKSGWDRALDIIAGVGEVIGGVAVMAFAGWTGIGAVAGGAIALDGLLRLGHSISDAARGTTTDTWQSQGFQALGASRDAANRIDTGLNLVATVPVGVGGAAIGAVKASTMLMKSVNVAGGVTVLDGAQAGTRYVATGEHETPFMVDGLMKAGLSQTQANYALMGGNLVATGGAVAAARGRSAGAVQPTTATDTAGTSTTTTTATTGTAQITDTTGTSTTSTVSTGSAQVTDTTGTSVASTASTGSAQVTDTTGTTVASTAATDSAQVAGTTDTSAAASSNTGATNGGTNNVSSNPQPVNASGLDPSANPWGPDGKGGKGVTLLTDNDKGVGQPTDVAILGGGNVGFTLSADLVANTELKPTLLFRGDGTGRDRISPVVGTYRFNETLHKGPPQFLQLEDQNFGYIATAEGARAMQQAKTLVVTLPDAPQTRLALFNEMQETGLVNDPAKTIVLIRGGQAGQPALAQMIRENPNWNASVVLVEDSPYGTRVQHNPGGEHIINGKRKDDVEISVLGDRGDQTRGSAAMREMFPLDRNARPWPDFNVVPGVAMPWRAGYFIHPGVAFDPVNLQRTANGEVYLHYVDGVHPALGEKLGRIDQERVDMAAQYGVTAENFPQKLDRQFGLTLQDESFYQTMQRTRDIYKSTSYPSLEKLMGSRYPQEDVPGLFTINRLGERTGRTFPWHAQYESEIRTTLRELGMSEYELQHNLGGYLPLIDAIEGGVPEITQLLNEPHVRPNA